MRRPPSPRAAWPLVAATLALAATLSLTSDAPASAARAAAADQAAPVHVAEVEGLSIANDASYVAATVGAGSLASFGLAVGDLAWAPTWTGSATLAPPAAPKPPPKATPKPSQASTAPAPAIWWTKYRGVNHVWMPTLGMSKSVSFYACGRTDYPANVVYRWGCAHTNNTYLFGHNFGVFHPLYQAYYNGKLRKGMPVVYADSHGRTRLYRVTTWRVVKPTDVAWAVAAQVKPSMTLQTCIGPNGSLRLLVRLVVATR